MQNRLDINTTAKGNILEEFVYDYLQSRVKSNGTDSLISIVNRHKIYTKDKHLLQQKQKVIRVTIWNVRRTILHHHCYCQKSKIMYGFNLFKQKEDIRRKYIYVDSQPNNYQRCNSHTSTLIIFSIALSPLSTAERMSKTLSLHPPMR